MSEVKPTPCLHRWTKSLTKRRYHLMKPLLAHQCHPQHFTRRDRVAIQENISSRTRLKSEESTNWMSDCLRFQKYSGFKCWHMHHKVEVQATTQHQRRLHLERLLSPTDPAMATCRPLQIFHMMPMSMSSRRPSRVFPIFPRSSLALVRTLALLKAILRAVVRGT